jgi:hypothetical protein
MNYSTSQLTMDQFGAKCGVKPVQNSIAVPVIKHIVHQRPVVYETITEEVTYQNVPIIHSFEQRSYPQDIKTQCAVPQAAPVAAAACGARSCGC